MSNRKENTSLYRQMEMIIFYDLPTKTKQNFSDANKFRVNLEKLGFYMLQESIYIKHLLDWDWVSRIRIKVENILPPDGDIRILIITTKEYKNIEIVRGRKSNQESKVNYERFLLI